MEEKTDNKNRTLIIVILLACAAAFLVAGYELSHSLMEYETGKIEYSKVSEKYVTVKKKPDKAPLKVNPEEEEAEEEESPWTEDQSIPDMQVDYEALHNENPDYFCWLYLPATGISYPVVKGEDNDYYLHHTFQHEDNVNGCIYMDNRAWSMSDYNVYIFGHNMRNGSMFGSLKHMLNDPELAKEFPYFYLSMKDEVWKYHIYSLHVTPPNSFFFHNPTTKAEYEEYIQKALEESIADMEEPVSIDDKTVTLSTCSGTGAGKKRLVVHGKLVGIIKTDGSKTVSYNYARPEEEEEEAENS